MKKMNSLLSEHELSLLDECYREIFNDRDCGRPEEITELGVTALIGEGIDAWNKWRSDYPSHKKIQLSNLQPNFRFLNDFSIFNFSKEVSFSNFHFKEKVSFEGVEFLQNVDFEGCVFYDDVNFHYVKFKGNVKFNGVVINPKSKFNFTEVIFKGNVDFSSVDFELWKVQRTRNESREYRDNYFMDIVSANLSSEMFPEIDFSKSIFHECVKFNGRIFKGRTFFNDTVFKKAPEFFGAKIHPKTSIETAKFPDTSITSGNAINEYRVLKLAFAELKNTRQELRFLRREMMEEKWIASSSHRMWLMVYQFISDFGFSVFRPSLGLLFSVLGGLFFYLWLSFLNGKWFSASLTWNLKEYVFGIDWEMTLNYIGFSFSNSLPFLSSVKFDEKLIECLFGTGVPVQIVKSLAVFQQSISFLFWFLIGLALRNKFKLK